MADGTGFVAHDENLVVGPLLDPLDLPAAAAREEAAGPVPSRLHSTERALLVELVRRTWRGEGAIIDGGSFLGTSAVSMARGLEANPALPATDLSRFPAGRPLHAYELGVLPVPGNRWAPRVRTYGDQEVVLGESFVPVLERNLAPYRHLVDLHVGDFNDEKWDGTPIEIAFLDICKTADLNAHAVGELFPALVPGRSTLIQQDFFFDQLPWIRVTMGYLREYFRWEGQAAMSSVYSTVRAVPADVAAHDPFLHGDYEECLAYHEAASFPPVDRRWRLCLLLSRSQLMSLKGHKEEALELLLEVAVDHADLVGDPGSVERFRLDRAVSAVVHSLCRERRSARAATPPAGPAPGPRTEERDDPLGPARAAVAAGDWPAARRLLERRATRHPGGPAAALLAEAELGWGDAAAAGRRLDEVLARRPRNVRARALRARVHLALADRARARAEAEEALAIDPDLAAAHRVLFDVAVAERLAAR